MVEWLLRFGMGWLPPWTGAPDSTGLLSTPNHDRRYSKSRTRPVSSS